MKLSDHKKGKRITAIFKGSPGSGKSIAIASFPKVLILDIDRRIESVANYWGGKKDDIEFEQYNTFDSLDSRIQQLTTNCPYDTVALSSLTRLARMIMKQMLVMKGDNKGKKIGGLSVNTVEDYNGETAGIVKIIENLLILPCHLILECHTTKGTDIKSGTDTIRILTGGKGIAAEIPGYFNEVWYFMNEPPVTSNSNGSWKFYTRAYGAHDCKTAMNMPYSVDFTDKSVFNIIQEVLGKESLDIAEDKAKFQEAGAKIEAAKGKVLVL